MMGVIHTDMGARSYPGSSSLTYSNMSVSRRELSITFLEQSTGLLLLGMINLKMLGLSVLARLLPGSGSLKSHMSSINLSLSKKASMIEDQL